MNSLRTIVAATYIFCSGLANAQMDHYYNAQDAAARLIAKIKSTRTDSPPIEVEHLDMVVEGCEMKYAQADSTIKNSHGTLVIEVKNEDIQEKYSILIVKDRFPLGLDAKDQLQVLIDGKQIAYVIADNQEEANRLYLGLLQYLDTCLPVRPKP